MTVNATDKAEYSVLERVLLVLDPQENTRPRTLACGRK